MNRLPSALQIGDHAYTFSGIKATVIGVRFVQQTVRYDLELTLEHEGSGSIIKTRIYNVESKFVSRASQDVPGYKSYLPDGVLTSSEDLS